MATQIKMPQLSDTMHQGKILLWKKKKGDKVVRGDILAEVETDKANLEIECFNPGVMLDVLVAAGDVAAVGEVICIIGEAGEKTSLSEAPLTETKALPQTKAKVVDIPNKAASLTQQKVACFNSGSERLKVSPLARKIAADRNINLQLVDGSGPNGRIIKRDLDKSFATSSNQAVSEFNAAAHMQEKMPAQTASAGAGGTITPLSNMRNTIARRMQQSVNEAPHFYSTTSIDMSEAIKLRASLKEKDAFKGISVNHLVIKGAAHALQNVPQINSAYREGGVYQPDEINIGVITAIPDGLLIPVIREANRLSLRDIVFETRAAVERAKAGRPTSLDLLGGTFSISNMGMFDVENFTAIINPGQGAILAVSAIKDMPAVKNGAVVASKQMKVTLSVDHRIIDGIMAANFLNHFKEALENPAIMFV